MSFKFDRHTVYSIEELKEHLPISPETFLERLGIEKRFNGVVLGADVIRVLDSLDIPFPKEPITKPVPVKGKILTMKDLS